MKKNYSILILGNIYDNHIIRFIEHLKMENESVVIDCVSVKENKVIDDYVEKCVNKLYLIPNSMNWCNVPILRTLVFWINYYYYFNLFLKKNQYDIVNIHFIRFYQIFLGRRLKKIASNMILTPWGSDVYRINKMQQKMEHPLYDIAQYVTGVKDRFTLDFQRIFKIPQAKIIDLGIGSEMIDYINQHKSEITINDAKEKLGIIGKYVITCGYNASPAQQHYKIIDAIYKVKDKLPSNLVLLFPFTYPQNDEYKNKIKEYVNQLGLNAVYFDKYLDLDKLFNVRQATDMFIHIQTTDANCASLREYMLLNKKIINGSWLEYDDLESLGEFPYEIINKIDELPNVILELFKSEGKILNLTLEEYISSMGCIPWAKKWNEFFMKIS